MGKDIELFAFSTFKKKIIFCIKRSLGKVVRKILIAQN